MTTGTTAASSVAGTSRTPRAGPAAGTGQRQGGPFFFRGEDALLGRKAQASDGAPPPFSGTRLEVSQCGGMIHARRSSLCDGRVPAASRRRG